PSASRVSLALFDAGPDQLGGPRIAHLAAWIVLIRRAESAGSQFGWGTLQQPEAPVLSGFNQSEVMRLIEARSASEVTANDVAAWVSRVANWAELDDLWFIGGDRLTNMTPAGASRLVIRDLLEPDGRALSFTVRGATSGEKEFSLDLPEENDCARLLRDPFKVAAAAPPVPVQEALRPRSNLIFDASGIKLLSRSVYDRVIAYPVPNSPRASSGAPKLFRAHNGKPVAAAGRVGKALCLISTEGTTAIVEYKGKPGNAPPAGRYLLLNEHMAFAPPDA